MKQVNITSWNRHKLYTHFLGLKDPYFGVTIPFDVTRAYEYAKDNNISFFVRYLHDCLKAINKVDNFRYRIIDDQVIDFNVIYFPSVCNLYFILVCLRVYLYFYLLFLFPIVYFCFTFIFNFTHVSFVISSYLL